MMNGLGMVETKQSPTALYGRQEYYEFRRYVFTRKRRIAQAFGVLSRDMGKLVTSDSARAIIRRGKLPAQIRNGWAELTSGFVTDSVMPEYYHTIDLANEALVKKILRTKGGATSAMESAGIWANERGGTLLVDLTAAQMANAQAIIHAQVIWGVTSPHQLAQMMKPMVGLTKREALAVSRFYQGMIADGVSPQSAVGRLDKYAKFLHGNRADRIARTELADAYNFGQINSVRGALDEGLLEGTVEKYWMAGGANPCEICLENEAAGYIKLDASFPSGDDHPTAHPDCECAVGYRVKRSGARMGVDESSRIPGRGPGTIKRGQGTHVSPEEWARIQNTMGAAEREQLLTLRIKDTYLKATGKTMSDQAAQRLYTALMNYTGEQSAEIRLAQLKMRKHFSSDAAFNKWVRSGDRLEDYLKFAPQFDPKTTIYRGVSTEEKVIARMEKQLANGEIKAGQRIKLDTTTHWSSSEETAQYYGNITFETKGLKQSTSVHQFCPVDEVQIMVSRNVEYTIKDIKVSSLGYKGKYKYYRIILEGK